MPLAVIQTGGSYTDTAITANQAAAIAEFVVHGYDQAAAVKANQPATAIVEALTAQFQSLSGLNQALAVDGSGLNLHGLLADQLALAIVEATSLQRQLPLCRQQSLAVADGGCRNRHLAVAQNLAAAVIERLRCRNGQLAAAGMLDVAGLVVEGVGSYGQVTAIGRQIPLLIAGGCPGGYRLYQLPE